MTAFFLQLLVYVMVDEEVEEEDEEMNEGLEGWMVGWQVGITWRNDRCLPTAAHCPYTSCITHIDYLLLFKLDHSIQNKKIKHKILSLPTCPYTSCITHIDYLLLFKLDYSIQNTKYKCKILSLAHTHRA